MTALAKIVVTSILSFLFFSCNVNFTNQLDGKGEVSTVEHELEPFNQVDVSNSWNVVLLKSNEPKLVVKANENLHEVLEFSVENSVLTISSEKNIGNADAKTIKVFYTGTLEKIAAHSGSSIASDAIFKQEKILVDASSGAAIMLTIDTKTTAADASSGAEIELAGTSIIFESEASSGSQIHAKELETKTAVADASSGAAITLTVLKNFTAEASSGGNIDYYGDPEKTAINNSISGDVSRR